MTDPARTAAAVRAYYLTLPNKTAEGWANALADPRKFNYVWRHMLHHACGQTLLEVSTVPPPIHLRDLVPDDPMLSAAVASVDVGARRSGGVRRAPDA